MSYDEHWADHKIGLGEVAAKLKKDGVKLSDLAPDSDLDKLRQQIAEHNQKALRYNQGKPKWSMVHFRSLEPMVKVLMYGANKYSRDNWKKGLDRQEILDSMQRHLAALIDGQEIDPESQEHHIGHIMCNCMFYSYFNIIGEDISSE